MVRAMRASALSGLVATVAGVVFDAATCSKSAKEQFDKDGLLAWSVIGMTVAGSSLVGHSLRWLLSRP